MANLKDIIEKVKAGYKDKGVNLPTAGGGTSKTAGTRISSGFRMPWGEGKITRGSTTQLGYTTKGTVFNASNAVKKNIFGLEPGELLLNIEDFNPRKFRSSAVPPGGAEFVDQKLFQPSNQTFADWYNNYWKKQVIRNPQDLAEYRLHSTNKFLNQMGTKNLTKLKGGTGVGLKTYAQSEMDELAKARGYIFSLPGKVSGQTTVSMDKWIGDQMKALDIAQESDVKFGDTWNEIKKSKKYAKTGSGLFSTNRMKYAMESVIDGVSTDAVFDAKKTLGNDFDFDSPKTKKVIADNFKKLLKKVLFSGGGVMAVISEGMAASELNPDEPNVQDLQYSYDVQKKVEENPELRQTYVSGVPESPRTSKYFEPRDFQITGYREASPIKEVDNKKETGIMSINEKFK